MEYKVIPFQRTDNPTLELQKKINSEIEAGYRYVNHEYSDKLQPGNAGCFGLNAQPATTVHIGFIVFEKM